MMKKRRGSPRRLANLTTSDSQSYRAGARHARRPLELSVLPNGGGQIPAQSGSNPHHWNSASYRMKVHPQEYRPRTIKQSACHGAEGDRTPDLCSAIAALSQLSYSPDKHLRPTRACTPHGIGRPRGPVERPRVWRGRNKLLKISRSTDLRQAGLAAFRANDASRAREVTPAARHQRARLRRAEV
jgi:hypothetical protein